MFLQVTSALKIWNNPTKSADEIRALQTEKLRVLIHESYKNVPFYRKLFDERGISPGDIEQIEDLRRLPVLKKQAIRDGGATLRSTKYRESDLICQQTGGSTGVPLSVYRSHRSAALDKAAKLRTYMQNGYKLHYKIAVAQHATPEPKAFHKFGIHREIGIPYDEPIEEQVRRISVLKAEVIDAQPNRIELMSRYLLDNSMTLEHVRIIFTHSEKITDPQRELVQEAFGLNPIDCYGCTESAAIAAECEAHEGHHINSDLVVLETLPVIHENVNESLQRIVITNLNNLAMPLIRYEVGDLATLSKDSCSCGSNFPLIAEIAGRMNDMVTLPNGQKVSGFVLARAIEEHQAILKYRAVQTRAGNFEIDLIVADGAEAPESKLARRIATDFPGVKVEFRYPDEIPLSPRGKLVRFESEMGS